MQKCKSLFFLIFIDLLLNIFAVSLFLYNDYKTKGTVRAEQNKDPRSHQVVIKNGMAGV